MIELISAGFTPEWILEASLQQIYYWFTEVELRKNEQQVRDMQAMSVSIASAMGSKPAAKMIKQKAEQAYKGVTECGER